MRTVIWLSVLGPCSAHHKLVNISRNARGKNIHVTKILFVYDPFFIITALGTTVPPKALFSRVKSAGA